ncbi:MAG: hypothetical protein LBR54_02745 [Oscillospiraceae bacterium]|jgi:hypothetical protein|nr:hypothetical protein [Oscillospiraceae bacterium]
MFTNLAAKDYAIGGIAVAALGIGIFAIARGEKFGKSIKTSEEENVKMPEGLDKMNSILTDTAA